MVGFLLRISAGVSFEQDFPEFRPQLSESSWLVCKFRDTFFSSSVGVKLLLGPVLWDLSVENICLCQLPSIQESHSLVCKLFLGSILPDALPMEST